MLNNYDEEEVLELSFYKREIIESFLENLTLLKDNYAHLDTELGQDLESLILDYEQEL